MKIKTKLIYIGTTVMTACIIVPTQAEEAKQCDGSGQTDPESGGRLGQSAISE
jgi:hypothetical protein